MMSPLTTLAHPTSCVFLPLTLLGIAWVTGWALVDPRALPEMPLARLTLRLVAGLVGIVGICAVACCGRICYLAAMPLSLLAGRFLLARAGMVCDAPSARWKRGDGLKIAAAVAGALMWSGWFHGWDNGNGTWLSMHSDLGYLSQLTSGVRESGVFSLWTATLGKMAATAGEHDVWYHWSPIALASVVQSLTGLPAITSLLLVVGGAVDVVILLAAGSMVSLLTRWAAGRSLVVGAVSLLAVQLARTYGVLWLSSSLPFGATQHIRWTLLTLFSYEFEGMVLLGSLVAWQGARSPLALLLLFSAGISAPHNVAAAGVTAAMFGALAAAMRDRRAVVSAVWMIATLLAAWGVASFGFGAGLPKAEGQALMSFGLESLRLRLRAGVIDTVLGSVFGVLSLPGIIHLIRARDEHAGPRTRMLGWLALGAVVGSYSGYHFLDQMADSIHFITFAHAVFVLPVGVWGLARKVTLSTGWPRAGAIAIIALSALMGLHDVYYVRLLRSGPTWSAADVGALSKAVHGEQIGYFSTSDRGWWISKHSVLASWLDTRCVRLTEDRPVANGPTKYYGASVPFKITPRQKGETNIEWSLRFARALGIRFVIEVPPSDMLPASVKAAAKPILVTPKASLYALPE